MRIVVTGREGQIARSLLELAPASAFEVVAIGRPQLDLAGDPESIVAAISAAAPDVIVSAAGYTQVDKAESEAELAFAVNAEGPRALARAAGKLRVPLMHVSTDYVFDGTKTSPYVEDDPTAPTSVYGASKLAGERAVLEQWPNSVVLRTAWVYSPFGTNFVKTMLRLARTQDTVAVIDDQTGNPSSALDIAAGILRVARNLVESPEPNLRGIFHMTGRGEATWADFAEAIFAASSDAGGPIAQVERIGTTDFPTAAERPANSRLDSGKLDRLHAVRLPDWREAVKEVVTRLLASGA